MNYASGELARLWDRVEVWTGNRAIVVFSIDTDEFSEDFPKAGWVYLGRGVMLESQQAGLIHYEEPDEGMRLISRGGPPTPEEMAALRAMQAKARDPRPTEESR
jgi:hypothetical protein